MHRFYIRLIGICVFLSVPMACLAAFPNASYRQDRILLKPKADVSESELSCFHEVQGVELLRTFALLKPAISETGLQWEVTYLRCALTWDLGIVCTSSAAGAW